MSRETNMTVGRPTKLILGLAVPLILTNVGQQLYTVADASIVGRGVGVEALAALGATDWLYWLVLWTVQAMTQGFSVLVSQTFGSNDKKGTAQGHHHVRAAVRGSRHPADRGGLCPRQAGCCTCWTRPRTSMTARTFI